MKTCWFGFQRIWLPGLPFKDAVIGGGYATELEPMALLFPSAPRGRVVATAIENRFR
jgi:hypothetical protein